MKAKGTVDRIRQHRTITAILIGLTIVFVSVLYLRGNEALVDFDVFHTAGARLLGGEDLYPNTDGHYQLKYLPESALFFIPFSILSPTVARSLWLTIVVASLFLTLFLLWRMVPFPRTDLKWLLLFVIVGSAKFIGRELILGQANLIFLALTLATVYTYQKGERYCSGILLGVAFLFKPYALIFFPYFLLRRAFRALAGVITIVLCGGLILIMLVGSKQFMALHSDWWQVVSVSTAPLLANHDNISLLGAVSRWGITDSPQAATVLSYALATLLGCMLLVRMLSDGLFRSRSSKDRDYLNSKIRMIRDMAFLLILIPLISPQGWDYVLLLAIPGLWLLARFRKRLSRPTLVLALSAVSIMGLSLYDLFGRVLYSAFMRGAVITVCALLLSIILLLLPVTDDQEDSRQVPT